MSQSEGSASPAEPARKRNDPGVLGEGTPGSRIKAAWAKARSGLSLKEWVFNTHPSVAELTDISAWVESKRPGGGEAAVKARRERNKEQRSLRALAQAAQKSQKGGGRGGSR